MIIGFAAQQSIYTVEPGQRAVIFDRFRGITTDVISEGTHIRIPGIQFPKLIDIRTTPSQISTVTGTKDLQTVNLSLRVLSKPSISKLPDTYKRYGIDWRERILPGICNEILKAVVAQKDAAELLTQRDAVSMMIRTSLRQRAYDFNIELDDVSITHLAFSKEFSKAIEDKQVAEQMAERAKFIVLKAEQEQQAAVIRAEGDSEAAKLVGNAIASSGRGLIEMRRIETALHIASQLNDNKNVTYLPGGNGNNLLLNVNK